MTLHNPDTTGHRVGNVVSVTLKAISQRIDVSGSPLLAKPYAYTSGSGKPRALLQGPTIHVRPGDTLAIKIINHLDKTIVPVHPEDGVIDAPTNFHYHGFHVTPLKQGDNIFRTFHNGGRVWHTSVHIPLEQPTGTFWYHSHLHGISDEQLLGGLSGLIIVDGITHYLPKAWRDAHLPVRAMSLRDVQTQADPPKPPPDPLPPFVPAVAPEIATESFVDPESVPPDGDSKRLLNTLYQPHFSMQAHRYERWELANVGSDVFYSLAFEGVNGDGVANGDVRKFVVIAVDGIPVWDVTTRSQLIMPPGRRYDVLVQGGTKGGSYVLRSQRYAQRLNQKGLPRLVPVPPGFTPVQPGPEPTEPIPDNQILARVTMTTPTRPQDPIQLPKHLAVRTSHAPSTKKLPAGHGFPLEDLSHEHVDKHRTFIFSYTPPAAVPFRALIGDGKHDPVPFTPSMQPLANPVLGDVEEWTLKNETLDQHPFHIHVNAFQVMSINGKQVDDNGEKLVDMIGHEDVVTIPAKAGDVPGEVVIRTKFLRFIGWFVFHCHILNHEDLGMMATIQVRQHKDSPTTPPPEGMVPHMAMAARTGIAAAGSMAMP